MGKNNFTKRWDGWVSRLEFGPLSRSLAQAWRPCVAGHGDWDHLGTAGGRTWRLVSDDISCSRSEIEIENEREMEIIIMKEIIKVMRK